MFKPSRRTDLALESANSVNLNSALPEGIAVNKRQSGCFTVTDVEVKSRSAAEKIGKPIGRYITLEAKSRLDFRAENFEQCAEELSRELSRLSGDHGGVLVAGLGNEQITPDSLGPRVCSHIFATRHIKDNAPELFCDGLGEVSAIAPGVMGQTGVEATELIKAACEVVSPSIVIAVDALACSEPNNLGKTIQLTDAGISPGSGVLNSRKELSRLTLGRPCIAIGIPTIAELGEGGEPLMVTPRSVDKLISCSAQLVSAAINLFAHKGLSLDEIVGLTS